jgi:hypothetical protein
METMFNYMFNNVHTSVFLIGLQLDPLGTAATKTPIVPAPDDYDYEEIGEMIGRGNRSTRREPAPVPLCPPQTPLTHVLLMKKKDQDAHPCPLQRKNVEQVCIMTVYLKVTNYQ